MCLFHQFGIVGTLLLTAMPPGLAAGHSQTSSLTGRVIDASTNQPLKNIVVQIPEIKRRATTDPQGLFIIEHLPVGRYLVAFQGNQVESMHIWVSLPVDKGMEIKLSARIPVAVVTVTATPWATHPMETAQQTASVSHEQLFAQSGMSVGEAIAELPGVRNVSTGEASGTPMIRGMVNDRVRVLDNGIGVNYQGFSRRHMPTLDPLDSDRIDVVRGPASVLYGSQAIGGAVNLTNAPLPTATDGKALLGGRLSLGHASASNSRVGHAMVEGAQGGFGWRLAGIERAGDNTRTPDGGIPNTDFRSGSWSVAGGYSGEWGQIQGRARSFDNHLGFFVPGSPLFRLNLQDELQALESTLYLPIGLLEMSATRQENHRRAYPGGIDATPSVNLFLTTHTYKSRLKHLPASGFQGDLALEYVQQSNDSLARSASGTKTLLPDYETRSWASSLFEEWRPDGSSEQGWILSLGLRHDSRTLDVGPDLRAGLASGLQRNYQATTGSIGAVYQFSSRHSLAATLGRGWRHPSEYELFAAGTHDGVAAYELGNMNLKEEKSLNAELSARVNHPRIKGSLTFFYNRFNDYIYLYETGLPPINNLPVLSFNQADARTRGIELEARVPLLDSFEIRGSYDHLRSRNESTGASLPFTPPDRASLGGRWSRGSLLADAPQGHVDINAVWTDTGRPSGIDEPFGTRNGMLIKTGSYVVWNLDLGVQWKWGVTRLKSDLGITNLFDRRYIDFLDTYKQYYPAQGRSFRTTLTASF
ncbi:MAG: TonB-dependent receptor [Holophagaceae bacterium]|nr:TonB-dependent receptor [Holophagaceae bacterium]